MDQQKLEGLGTLVDEVEGPSPEDQAQAQKDQQQAETLEQGAREWGAIAFMIGGAVGMFVPEVKPIYTEDACLNWGRAMMPVAEKRGWNSPSALPELGLLIATMGMVVPTVMLVRAKVAAIREGKESPEKAGIVGQVVAWWRKRREGKAQAQEKPASPLDGVHGGG